MTVEKTAHKRKWKRPFAFIRLLLSANPTKLDFTLLGVGITAAIGSGIPFPLLGILFGELVDNLNTATCTDDTTTDASAAAAYQAAVNDKVLKVLYITIAYFALIYIHVQCFSVFGSRLAHRLRDAYFAALLRQEVAYFDRRLPPGEVASRLGADVTAIQAGASEKVGIWIYSISFFVTAYTVAFIKDAQLAGMLISLVPAFLAMSLIGGHYVEKFAGRVADHMAGAASVALEGLSNIMVVQAFRANERLERRFAARLGDARRDGIKKAVATAIQAGFLYFIAYAACGLAFWQGSREIADAVEGTNQGMSVGATYTVIFILVDASLVFSQVSPYLQIFSGATASFDKLQEAMKRQSEIDGTVDEQGDVLPDVAGTISIRNLSFQYPSRPDVAVIRNMSLELPAGKHVAIVGLSGSGKSTIAGLVTRLYDPQEGMILLDGRDIQGLNVRHLRSLIGLVQQDPLLLDRSVLENIAHGLVNSPRHTAHHDFILGPGLSQIAEEVRNGRELLEAATKQGPVALEIIELVQRAAALADATIFVQGLDHGFGTMIGAGGDRLSGGQKQRVALARALVKQPKILVLDEPTSSLDSATERRIQAAMERIVDGRTVITIAHRLATVRDAYNIVVMRDGEIVEQGSHAELLTKEGHYARLLRLQSSDADDGTSENSDKDTEVISGGEKAEVMQSFSVEGESPDTRIPGDVTATSQDLAPEDAVVPEKSPRGTLSILRSTSGIMRPYLLVLTLAFISSVVVGGSYSGEAVIFGNTVGSLSACSLPSAIRSAGSFYGLMFFILALVELAANTASWSAFGWVAERTLFVVRVLSFRSLFEQDLEWHQSEGRSPSGLLGFITEDSNALGGLTGSIVGTIFSIVVNLFAAIVLAHVIAWKIALVCLAAVPLMLGAGVMQLRELARFEERHEAAFSRSIALTVEAVTSIRAVAALSLEREVLLTYRRSLAAPRKEMARASAYANFWLSFSYSMSNLIYALAYWWGAKLIIAGEYSQTQFFIVLVALLVSAQLWSQMFTLAPEVSRAKGAVGRILNLIDIGSSKRIDEQSLNGDAGGKKDVEAALGEKQSAASSSATAQGLAVRFNDVRFSYPSRPAQVVLGGLSLEVKPGQFCALVGPSGAGKSTIISLLERMYPLKQSSGSIIVDHNDIAATSEPTFRDLIGLVPQTPVLFDGTVRFNVALGAVPGREPTDMEVEEACRLANIHDTIAALPQGYETPCGPSGGQLSGGQKQRLAIARALVRKPRLLLLDESTSALDVESERALQEGLNRVMAQGGTTVLAIAHRLHTIRRADVIFLIKDGRCVDQGKHEELMARSESYREGVLHQATGAESRSN